MSSTCIPTLCMHCANPTCRDSISFTVPKEKDKFRITFAGFSRSNGHIYHRYKVSNEQTTISGFYSKSDAEQFVKSLTLKTC